MEHNEQKTLKEKVLGAIDTKKLSMHSKYYFALRVAALVLVSVAIFFISIFLFNFILFSVRINSSDTYLFMGPHGWQVFLHIFPWHLLAIDALLIVLLLWLLRQFRFGYQSPTLYVLIGILLATAAFGLVVDRATGINDHFLREAEARRLPPPLRDFYGHVRRIPPGEFKERIENRVIQLRYTH